MNNTFSNNNINNNINKNSMNKKNKLDANSIKILHDRALQLSIDAIRATTAAGSGHPTSCMSSAHIIATLFFHELSFDLADPLSDNNDRFIISKGHAVPILYAAYKQLGVLSSEELLTLRQSSSYLEGHPTPRFVYNETATGSLGQGLAVGVGMALAARLDQKEYRTVILLGDGEIAEGSVWEAASMASAQKLSNLIAIVDVNRLGQSGTSLLGHEFEMYKERFAAFGWQALVVDGHDCQELIAAYTQAGEETEKPTVIIAKTMKGFGLVACENKIGFHGKPFSQKEALDALSLLEQKRFFPNEPLDKKIDETKAVRLSSELKIQEYKKTHYQDKIIESCSEEQEIAEDHIKIFNSQEKCSARKSFGYALAHLGRLSKKIIALDADVKNSTHLDIFEKEHAERFVQCFIAEQLLIGCSVGLETRGKIPFAATFGAFFTRAFDQLRMAGIGKNALRLCGTHCGVSIGEDGPSQMALEDIAMIGALPGSIILYPSDAISAYKLTLCMANYSQGISYLRATRGDTAYLYKPEEHFKIGGSKLLRSGPQDQVLLIAAGITVHEALKAATILASQDINVAVLDLYSVKPFDKETVVNIARKSQNRVITIEDHYEHGGIGQMIAAQLNNSGISVSIMAVRGLSRSGKPDELLALAGINAEAIVKKVKEITA